MALFLVVTYPDKQSETFALSADEVIIGRDPDVAIALPDSKASRRHARLFRLGSGYWLEDLKSANGVLLDGLPLSGQALITPGSVLEIGDCKLVVTGDGAPSAAVPPEAPPHYVRPAGELPGFRAGTQFALKVVAGELLGQSFVLAGQQTIVGRGAEADVALDVPSISRRHAVITKRDADSVTVEDLGSANGTFIGELPLSEARVVALGERVRFGSLVFELGLFDGELGRSTEPQPTADLDDRHRSAPGPATEPLAEVAARRADGPAGADQAGSLTTAGLSEKQGAAERPAPAPAHQQSSPRPAAAEPAPAAGKSQAERSLPASPHAGGAKPARRSSTNVSLAQLQTLVRALSSPQLRRRFGGKAVWLIAVAIGAFVVRAGVRSVHEQGRGELLATCQRVLHQLSGYGPQAAEHAWRLHRDDLLKQAEAAIAQSEWDKSHGLLSKAAELDATYGPLLTLKNRYERGLRADNAALLAANHRASSRWSQALLAASDALEDLAGDPRPAAAQRRLDMALVVADSKQHLAGFCADEARVACGQERYENCITQSACALGYSQANKEALAALNLAAGVVDPAGALRPVPGKGAEGGVDVGSAPAIDRQLFASLYPDAKVRLAVLTYAAGEQPLALLRLRDLDNEHSRPVLADVTAVAAAMDHGAQGEQSGAWEGALADYQAVLDIDGRLVPRELPSVPRSLAIAGAERILLTLGNMAFGKEDYREAARLFQRGQSFGGTSLALTQAISRLDAQADALLAELKAKKSSAGEAKWCQKAAEVSAMVAPGSGRHAEAERLSKECPQASKPAAEGSNKP